MYSPGPGVNFKFLNKIKSKNQLIIFRLIKLFPQWIILENIFTQNLDGTENYLKQILWYQILNYFIILNKLVMVCQL